MRRPRRLVLSAAALGVALSVTGCAYINPVQTHDFYQSGDGQVANLGETGAVTVGIRNAIVVVGEDGSAELLGTLANYTGEDVTVELEGVDDGLVVFSGSVPVPADGVVTLGAEGDRTIPIGGPALAPGSVIDVVFSEGGDSTELTVPVTDRSLAHYSDADSAGELPAG